MKSMMWVFFVCVQAAGVFALNQRPDSVLIFGVMLLFPGLPALYLISDVHRHFMIRDLWLTFAALIINAAVWQVTTLFIQKVRTKSNSE
jgi:hypothetical protein